MNNQPVEYFIWIKVPNGESWSGLMPVTRERGEKLVAKFSKKYPENRYWIEPVEPPHAETMRKSAIILRATANDLLSVASDLERFAFWPVVFAELPEGECDCFRPEQTCPICEKKAGEVYSDVMELL